ncbi:MAG: formyltetrahydrofolate deformylase [Fibrobacterota bacterium]
MNTAILLSSCPDAKGVVARVTGFLNTYGAKLVHADHHADLAQKTSFLRLEWELEGFSLDAASFRSAFSPIAQSMGMDWNLRFSSHRPKVGILVSKQDHCLVDLLHRFAIGELPGEVSFVAGNHRDAKPMVEHYGLPWIDLSAKAGDEVAKAQSEAAVIDRMQSDNVELVVLARYMQVLSGRFLSDSSAPVINIHHSFLPAFKGGKPYHQAWERGVKIIGATAHYVTEDLDEGPIIGQDVSRVSHRDTVDDLVRKGRDLEKLVLSRALRLHLSHRVIRHRNRTVVFD